MRQITAKFYNDLIKSIAKDQISSSLYMQLLSVSNLRISTIIFNTLELFRGLTVMMHSLSKL